MTAVGYIVLTTLRTHSLVCVY